MKEGQRAAAIMVGEVDRRDTADAVKRFRPEMRDAAESHLRQGEGDAALRPGARKTWLPGAARALRAAGETPRAGCGEDAENSPKSAVFCRPHAVLQA